MKAKWWLVIIFLVFVTINVHAQHWMPDENLQESIKRQLKLSEGQDLTIEYVQLHLTALITVDVGVADLTGLEYATDLQYLDLSNNKIQDISPLSNLTRIYSLQLARNMISDLRPLSDLTHIEYLNIAHNNVTDISPLSELVNLKKLDISNNEITDVSPLLELENLQDLRSRNINILSMPISKIKQFGYDETCDVEGLPILDRINNRDHPSIFAAWGNIINLPNVGWFEKLTHHDLIWSGIPYDSFIYAPSPDGLKTLVHVEYAKEQWKSRLDLNTNFISIVALNYQAASNHEYPEDWEHWVRDESGNRISDARGVSLIDFTHPEIQDLEVNRVVNLAKCGLFDGVFLDWWRNEWKYDEEVPYYTHDIHEAAITLVRSMREAVDEVREDFLIIVNTGYTKIPRSAPYVNGMFLETIGPYPLETIIQIENTLLWGEQNLREPQINSLEGWSIETENLDSIRNKQRMRFFTTMNLTFSDGYVLFSAGNNYHNHYWYPFYDAPLGKPMGGDETKGVLYRTPKGVEIEGLFIREFTNGWAVYNRSGKERRIYLPEKVDGWSSGEKNKRWHTIPDLDGEIYIKSLVTLEDVNADGTVNILDVVMVANAMGESSPDLNGDNVVNILDLVLVSQKLQ